MKKTYFSELDKSFYSREKGHDMKYCNGLLFCIFLLFAVSGNIFGQGWTVKGTVVDKETNEPLIGANVVIKGTAVGAITDWDGSFSFETEMQPPMILQATYIGYLSIDIEIDNKDELLIKLDEETIIIEGVEVRGQRISDKQKSSPLTVESLDLIAIKETPSSSFYDGLGSLKDVDLTAASLGFKVINTRGFNSTSPVRSLQIIDGVDNQSPGLNFSLGNFLGVSELDINKVDIIVGASSAFYGPNAFNGVISMQTKDPFIHTGLSAQLKYGERNLFEAALRYGQSFKNKNGKDFFAYKINLFYLTANDWEANNLDPVYGTDFDRSNPGGYDAVNIYGDEYQSGLDYTGSSLIGLGAVHRTGYSELDLVDYDTRNQKASVSLHWRLKPNDDFLSPQLIVQSNYGGGTTVYQGDNRFSLRNIKFFQHRVELRKENHYFLRAYVTHEDAGDSYDPYFTALLLQERAKTNAGWGLDYGNYWGFNIAPILRNAEGFPRRTDFIGMPEAYQAALQEFLEPYYDDLVRWHQETAAFANSETSNGEAFYEPGTERFEEAFREITTSLSYSEGGTRFYDKSALAHIHGEYKFNDLASGEGLNDWDITVGGNYRMYLPDSRGSILLDTNGRNINTYEFGFYVGNSMDFFNKKLKWNVTLRTDKHENFDWLVSPATSLVYTPNQNQYFRVSFSSGIRNPTLTDQYLFYNVGRAILLGNIDGVNGLVTVESLYDYLTTLVPNPDTLQYIDIPAIRPESVRTIEFGARTTLFEKLYVDAGYYYSFYKNFIGYQLGVDARINPTNGRLVGAQAYRVAANAQDRVTTQGFSIGLTYYLWNKYALNGNYSWNVLNTQTDDPIIPAYNTPEHKYNIGFSGRNITVNLGSFSIPYVGFNINYKWIDGFLFEGSPQFTGFIDAYGMLDAQVNKKFRRWKTTLKVGASNILNNQVYQIYGGPLIGRLGYVSIVYDMNDK